MCQHDGYSVYEITMARRYAMWIAEVTHIGHATSHMYTVRSISRQHCQHKALNGIFDLQEGAIVHVTVQHKSRRQAAQQPTQQPK